MKFKNFLKILIILIFIPSLIFSVSCKKQENDDDTDSKIENLISNDYLPYLSDLAFDGRTPRDSIYKLGGDSGSSSSEGENIKIEAGQLTASALFDNDNYEYFYSLTQSSQEGKGAFQTYQEKFEISLNRIALKITNGALAKVSLLNDDKIEFETYADKNGNCYLFNDEKRDEYTVSVRQGV